MKERSRGYNNSTPVPLRALAKLGLKFSRDFSAIKG